ncbi:hypothetical protein MCOR25_011073 [Pyricularia grisea]|nr:hypothetical protein MCOR25_011073 [Pyricularia grisea]
MQETHAATPHSVGSKPQVLQRRLDEGEFIPRRVVRRYYGQDDFYSPRPYRSQTYTSSRRPASSYNPQRGTEPAPFPQIPQPSDGSHNVQYAWPQGQPQPASYHRDGSNQPNYFPSEFSRDQPRPRPPQRANSMHEPPPPPGGYKRRKPKETPPILPLDRGDGEDRLGAPSPPPKPHMAWLEQQDRAEQEQQDRSEQEQQDMKTDKKDRTRKKKPKGWVRPAARKQNSIDCGKKDSSCQVMK